MDAFKNMSEVNGSVTQKVYHTLRIAVALCFIGHGAFGIITKAIWCNYFAVAGISTGLSYQLMPVVGTVDVLFGLTMLVYPTRFVAGWLVVWGVLTAMLRPISGEPFAEFIERAGNYGAPLALLIMAAMPRKPIEWFHRIKPVNTLPVQSGEKLYICLRVAGFLLFAGHGWLNLLLKKGLLVQYASLGFSVPETVAYIVGITEILFAFLILVRPVRELLLLFFIWKMLSETLYANYPLFEWIERAGSYGVMLALYFLTPTRLFVKMQAPTKAIT